MPAADSLSDLLACPRCDGSPLRRDGTVRRCGSCKTEFPAIGGIPWLFAEPDASRGEWQNRLSFELARLAREVEQLEAALDQPKLSELTRRRLDRQVSATEAHRESLQRLLAPLDLHAGKAGYESHLALRTRLPVDQALDTYYANVHRDWAWGDEENAASVALIRDVLEAGGPMPAADGADLLVLGSGASRLAYDLHMQVRTARTVALDFNPLLLLIARAVTSGGSLTLHEFPVAPRSLDDFAVSRTLRAPEPARDGLSFVLADVLRPPFRPAAFDLVVTPWLIDIVAEDLPVLAARINRLLKPGGGWVNSGSLAFDHPERARRRSPEEVVEIVADAGFASPAVRERTLPYMCSPASRHGRRETVFAFAAAKTDEKEAPRHRALPDWIVTGEEPVPLLPSFRTQAVSTRIYAFVMSLIDGRRSISEMADVLAEHKLMTRREAVPAIRGFLTRMYDDSQRRSEF